MKKRYDLWCLLLLAVFSSCSDFLKEEDQDLIIPRTVEQFGYVMHREAFLTTKHNIYTEFMTDNIMENSSATSQVKNLYKQLYTWQRDIEVDANGDESMVNVSWTNLYRQILVSNYVIENVSDAEGSDDEKSYLLGEAYFVRGKSILDLVNLYAKHYDPATAATDLGVPERTGTAMAGSYARATVARNYECIERDLKQAIEMFDRSGLTKSLWHPNTLATKLLLSRMYLYMSDWENCIKYATEVIDARYGMLWDLKEHEGSFVNTTNSEILHSWGDPASQIGGNDNDIPSIYNGGVDVTYGASTELENSFLKGDLRPAIIFNDGYGLGVPKKWNVSYTSLGMFNMRLAEAFLNRAEAYAMLDRDKEAYDDIYNLVESRVLDIDKIDIPENGLELKRFIFEERRRELCFEDFRWIDLKRTKLFAKQINHEFTDRNTQGALLGKETYMLMPNDPNYIFPIPQDEIDRNLDMVQNIRVEKIPIKEEY